MRHALTLLSWLLALASGWALAQARGASARAPALQAELAPRGAPLLSAPRRPAPEPTPGADAEPVARPRAAQGPQPVRVGETWKLDFALFEFDAYDPPELRGEGADPLPLERFPAALQPLHGERVTVEGYMQVTSFEAGRVRAFVLARYPEGCCFGGLPQYDEWLDVELAREAPAPLGSRPVLVEGRLELGELLSEDGFVLSLYRLREARLR